MKFFTPVFALFAASAVCANRSEGLINFLQKRDATMDESAFQNVSEACINEIKQYKPCLKSPSGKNFDKICQQIKSDECKNFASNPQSLLPSCKDYPQVLEYFSPDLLEENYSVYIFSCTKDEAGNQCPFGNAVANRKNDFTGSEAEKTMKDTCSSKICREATYEIFKNITDKIYNDSKNLSAVSLIDLADTEELLDFLDSDECKAMSGSSTFKIGTGIFVSLGLLLLSLY